jgi:hypothetical protein
MMLTLSCAGAGRHSRMCTREHGGPEIALARFPGRWSLTIKEIDHFCGVKAARETQRW